MALLERIPGIAGAWAAGYAVRSFLYPVNFVGRSSMAEDNGTTLPGIVYPWTTNRPEHVAPSIQEPTSSND